MLAIILNLIILSFITVGLVIHDQVFEKQKNIIVDQQKRLEDAWQRIYEMERYFGIEFKKAIHTVSVPPFEVQSCDKGCGFNLKLGVKHDRTPAHYEHIASEKARKDLEESIKNNKTKGSFGTSGTGGNNKKIK